MLVETVADLAARRHRGAGLVDHDNIETGQQLLLLAKRLPNESLNAVSCCRLATVFLGDCQTQPGDALFIAPA